MLHRSDKQGRPIIQTLILRAWEKNQLQLLTDLGGIDGEQRNEERNRLIEETIESLRLGPQDYKPVNHYEVEQMVQSDYRDYKPVNHYEFCDRFI